MRAQGSLAQSGNVHAGVSCELVEAVAREAAYTHTHTHTRTHARMHARTQGEGRAAPRDWELPQAALQKIAD